LAVRAVISSATRATLIVVRRHMDVAKALFSCT
jgi:hypothetical protein